ncbi:CoA transferase [Pseudomonas agarici]|uniref:CaiB/BaiF CoA transferase family protein n=1 Tax=Pseudomonas agarici TaxID=46677 RepID=UPI0002E405F9|nr:CaiB/BaiF CoA-transferase family protein [Pseudomonas agarici]NWC08205.1 CoA transferase [Pseudomonas agarici]SEK83993.1 Crotonobetainyl-CoA:carnitine CoA-transferase CaiB [Pseudomonas agarici]
MAGPLSHLRVLDMSRILAGPWASQNLADLGAEVIKIERPGHGDDTRAWGPPFLKNAEGGETSETAYFLCANRGKKSLTVDIATEDGRSIIVELVRQSDVLIENFKTGDLSRYGLDYDTLKVINPQLVYCSITGFGQNGPFKSQAGYDFMIQGTGGLMSLTGSPEGLNGGEPMKVAVPVADLMTGMYATVAIMAALTRRDRSGGGEHIDVALLDCQVSMLSNQAQNFLIAQTVPKRYGNSHPNVVPYQAFPTADGHLILAVGNDYQFSKFCEAAGVPWLAKDQRFITNAARVCHREELIPEMVALFTQRGTDAWMDLLSPIGVPCGPINRLDQTFDHPQVRHRHMKIEMDHPLAGKVPLVANPIHFVEHPIEYQLPPPLLGQHTVELLRDLLGMSEERIATLRESAIV